MSLINNIRNYFRVKASTENTNDTNKMRDGYEVSQYGGYNYESLNKAKFLEEMRSWVFGCVSSISDEIGAINLKLYKGKNDGEVEEIFDHPALSVLYKVNNFTTKFDHFSLTCSYLELTGESPWYVEKENNEPVGLFMLRPDKLTPLIDKDKNLSGYKYYTQNGNSITIPKDDIIFIKYPDPSNPFRGLGTLQAVSRTIDIDNASEDWNYNFFKNSARPDVLLTINGLHQMSQEQRDKLKKSIQESYQGTKNAHKAMVLFGDMTAEKFGFNQKDLDFNEQLKFSRDKILGIFRVPKAILSQTDGVNFASANSAISIYREFTIKPKMERITQQLNEFYLPMFKDTENMFFDYASPVREDQKEKLDRYANGLGYGWLTINEVRTSEGLETIDGYDSLYIPSSHTEGEGEKGIIKKKIEINHDRLNQINSKKYKPAYYDDVFDTIKGEIKTSIKKEFILNSKKDEKRKLELITKKIKEEDEIAQGHLNKNEREQWWNKKNKLYENNVDKIEDNQVKVFNSQEKKVLKGLGEQIERDDKKEALLPRAIKQEELNIDELLLDPEEEEKAEILALLLAFLIIYRKSGNETYDMMDLDQTINMRGVKNKLTAQIRSTSNDITKTTNREITRTLEEGIKNQERISDLTKRVKNVFKEATENRAKMIARTETNRIINQASEKAMIDSGIVRAKQWQINPGACPICRPLQGKIVGLGKDFFKRGDETTTTDGKTFLFDYSNVPYPPAHVNCLCYTIPVYFKRKNTNNYITKCSCEH